VPSPINATGTVSFAISTTAPTTSLNHPVHPFNPSDRGSRIFYAMLLPGLLGIVLAGGTRRTSLRGMRFLGLIVVLGFSTVWLASCGGSSSGTSNPGTPTGSYTISVNATSGTTTTTAATFQLVVAQ
jgi:hypothetical protein